MHFFVSAVIFSGVQYRGLSLVWQEGGNKKQADDPTRMLPHIDRLPGIESVILVFLLWRASRRCAPGFLLWQTRHHRLPQKVRAFRDI